jgi:putative membrane protein
MMFWDRHHEITAWWSMGIVVVMWVVIIGLLVWLVARLMSHRPASGESAEELLRRRFAAGEIDEEEFAKRSEVLRRK